MCKAVTACGETCELDRHGGISSTRPLSRVLSLELSLSRPLSRVLSLASTLSPSPSLASLRTYSQAESKVNEVQVQMMLTKQLHADAAAAAQIYSGIPCTLLSL